MGHLSICGTSGQCELLAEEGEKTNLVINNAGSDKIQRVIIKIIIVMMNKKISMIMTAMNDGDGDHDDHHYDDHTTNIMLGR